MMTTPSEQSLGSPPRPFEAIVTPVTAFAQNCALVWCPRTHAAAFIDPGGELERLVALPLARGLRLEKILLTHGHLDHAGAAAALSERFGVPIEGPHRDDDWLLDGLAEQGARYGLTDCRPCTPNRWLEDGDAVRLGEVEFVALHCPGHTPGHVAFFCPAARFAFVGDVLFKGSVGRTDFPRGDFAALTRSIREKLFPLGDDVRFLPGHGAISSLGWERKTNPFVSDLAVGAA